MLRPQSLAQITIPPGPTVYRYIDGILSGAEGPESITGAMKTVWATLIKLGLEVPESKCQGPAREVKFQGVWWVAGAASLPPESLEKKESGHNPSSTLELQQVQGTVKSWRNHSPAFSVIARPW